MLNDLGNRLQGLFVFGIVVAITLIFVGWRLLPTENPIGILATITILVAYGIVAWFASRAAQRIDPRIITVSIHLGLIAGIIFASEIVLEYILLPKDNTTYGFVEFGSVFLIYFLAGLITADQTHSIRNGVFSAIGTAMIATLIWIIFVLGILYLFQGTPQQHQVFQAEGDYTDFIHSGEVSFNNFIREDFMGAVFYHSLLGPIIAVILGGIGGILAKVTAKIRSR